MIHDIANGCVVIAALETDDFERGIADGLAASLCKFKNDKGTAIGHGLVGTGATISTTGASFSTVRHFSLAQLPQQFTPIPS